MSPEEFIKKHITDALVGEGFPEQVALGGGWSAWITITECHRQAVKGALTTTVCSMRVSGQKDKLPRQNTTPGRNPCGMAASQDCYSWGLNAIWNYT